MNNFEREASLVADALTQVRGKLTKDAYKSLLSAIMHLIKSNRPDWSVKASELIKFNYFYEMDSKTVEQIKEMERILGSLTDVVDEEEWYVAKKEIRQLLASIQPVKKHGFTVIDGGQAVIKKGK